MTRTILHIDFDSFFASVEQQDNPKLRGKPIGVTATNGRTCIIASSREAKVLGIKTGTRSWEAEKIYPKIILVPANFVKYWEISRKFINICKDYSPYVEVFSLDELFMDITKTEHLFGGIKKIVEPIKTRIRNEIGEYITVSIGISHNKLLAKLASGLKKPNGVFAITRENIDEVYTQAQLTDVCGIGERIKARLNTMGIYTLLQLCRTPLLALISEFGNVEGQILKDIGLGYDGSPIIPYAEVPEVKSVGRNYCLSQNEDDMRKVLQNFYELCEEVGIKLRRLNKKARTLGFSLRGNIDIHGRKTYKEYFDSGKEIFEYCLAVLRRHSSFCHPERSEGSRFFGFQPPNDIEKIYIRQISVWASNLEDSNKVPLSLFNIEKKSRLTQAIDKINEKFGDHTIRNGFLLYADKLTTVPNGYMADKYERMKLSQGTD